MKIILMAVGRMQNEPLRELTAEFVRRAGRYMPLEHVEIADVRSTRSLDATRQ